MKPSNLEETTNYEDYYDAYEDNEISTGKTEEAKEAATASAEDQAGESKPEKKNFLVTAIIPQDMNVQRAKVEDEDWMKVDQEVVADKRVDCPTKRGKKFTCELSIDFSAKRNQQILEENQSEIQGGEVEEAKNQTSESFDVIPFNGETKGEKPLVTFKKANKSLEIKITQMEQKEGTNQNYVHQKMIVKFAKEPNSAVGPKKPSKFEFNLALSGLGEGGKKTVKSDSENQAFELNISDDGNSETETSPRTVWNDATDDLVDAEPFPPEESTQEEITSSETESEADEKQSVVSEDSKGEPPESIGSAKSYEDSLRYEKNLEFLQQKSSDRVKDEDEEVSKEKPSAILIQNGQTKLALIRYQ